MDETQDQRPKTVQRCKGKATICIVNYKTADFIKLCLRSIRKFTRSPYEIIVIDNNSQDESVEYLRSLKWIRLIERDASADASGGYSHAAGLDVGLKNCRTEFFVSLHSDCFIKKEDWLGELINYFGGDEKTACVGSGKIETTPRWREFLKKATDLRTFKRKLMGQDRLDAYRYHNRTICCLYRTEILQRENLSFLTGRDKGLTSGQKLYFELIERGYKTIELPASVMGNFLVHLAHATQATHPNMFKLRNRTIRKFNRLAGKMLSTPLFAEILADESLDR